MRISPRLTALLTGLLLSASAATQAQTTPGQATLEEKKVQIWCATVRYVYNDNGRANLNNTLRCDGTLKAFENSIKADSQRVYSLMYRPLEGAGVMYKGLGSDQSRLQRLSKEIISKLSGSPQRRKNPARMAQLKRLEDALNGYVAQGTPISGDIGQVNAEAAEASFDSTATEAPETVATDAGDSETASPVPAAAASAESPMTKLFGPIALILSLLSLVLWFLERRVLRSHIGELRDRAARHRNELDSMKHTGGRSTGPDAAPADLTFSQRKQIEEVVERLVQQRLAEVQPHGRAAAEAEPALPLKPAAAPAIDVRKTLPVPPPAPAPRPAPAPVAPPVAQAPVAPVTEVPAPPVAIPAGPPAATPVDEFDSLVPPVQLPQSPVPVPPAPVAPQPEPMPLGKFYVKVPVNGGFSDYDLHTVAQHDSIYEITPDPQRPDVASFRINPDPQVHPYAIQSAQYSLREACRYQPPSGPALRIITEEPGQLRKVGGAWQIEQKAAIRFE